MSQFVFTEWDPTAATDMEALASYFDTNGDGVLDASGDIRRLAANVNRPPERPRLRSGTC